MVQSVACAGVGVGGGACELGVVDGAGGHGVFLFLAGCFLLRLYSITRSPLVSTRVETWCWGAWLLVEVWGVWVWVSPAGRLCGLFSGGACVSPYRCVLSYACFLSCWLLGERVHCGGGDGSVVGVVTLVL